jgi:SAM-dependent methyltransferase
MRKLIPWWFIIATKLVAARLPVAHHIWYRLKIFRHGKMIDPAYALGVFERHYAKAGMAAKPAFTCLEIGPGESAFSALVARSKGAAETILVDAGHYIRYSEDAYRSLSRFLEQQGVQVPRAVDYSSLKSYLESLNARYLFSGAGSLAELPDASVDFIWSQAVLEHIRKADFLRTLRELRRVMKPNGVASHRVDLKDHLGGSLNNLRFREDCWESEFMATSGFYTNRIRYAEMIELFERAGFRVSEVESVRWPTLPLMRARMALPFREMPEDDLRVSGFDVLLVPA